MNDPRNANSISNYFMYTRKTRYNVMSINVIRGAEVEWGHYLLLVKYRNIKEDEEISKKSSEKIKAKELLINKESWSCRKNMK